MAIPEQNEKIIGVNLVSVPKQMAGVGFLAVNLFQAFIAAHPQRKFVLYITEGLHLSPLEFPNALHKCMAPTNPLKKLIWEQFQLPKMAQRDNVDIMVNLHYTPLFFMPGRIAQFTFVYDLTYLRFFFQRHLAKSLFFAMTLPFSLLKSDRIITISHFTKNDLKRFFPAVSPAKISVMYLGVGNRPLGKPNPEEFHKALAQLGLKKKQYFLFVGTIEPTKNIYRNIEAFSLISKKHPQMKFLIVGKRGRLDKKDKRFHRLEYSIRSLGIEKKVVFTGYIETPVLNMLFKGAAGLLFTSLNEGFGIPLLEAMENEIPIITSNLSSMPEVAGEAALFVDPYSVEEIARAMETLASDEPLVAQLIEKGKERVKEFTWENSARQIENLF